LDFGGQGCEERLRGSGRTVWDYFGMRGFVLRSWGNFQFCYVLGSLKNKKMDRLKKNSKIVNLIFKRRKIIA
jgi:hypothetical protein